MVPVSLSVSNEHDITAKGPAVDTGALGRSSGMVATSYFFYFNAVPGSRGFSKNVGKSPLIG